MKSFNLLAALLVFIIVPAYVDAAEWSAAWQKCKTNKDCALTHNKCGWPVAFNKKHLDPVMKYLEADAGYCDVYQGPALQTLKAVCLKTKCESQPRSKSKSKSK